MIIYNIKAKLSAPEIYRDALRTAVTVWEKQGPRYSQAIGRSGDLAALLPVGLNHALSAESGRKPTKARIAKVRALVFKSGKLTKGEAETIREVARPYVEHVVTSFGLSTKFGAPACDWEDVGAVYRQVLQQNMTKDPTAENYIPRVRNLFDVSLPEMEPRDAGEFLRVVKKGEVRAFRTFVSRCADDKASFDPMLAQKLSIQVEHRKRRTGYIASGVTIFSAAGAALIDPSLLTPAHLLASAASIAATVAVVVDATNRVMDRAFQKDTGWFLCLANAKKGARR
jgi:hypothetical protein